MSGWWISVEERVPEENGTYPVFGMDTRGRKVRTLADWDARDNRWYTIDYGYHGEWTTHWAEWPEDPVG